MTSISGDYEEDWEVPEPSVNKKSVVSATQGQVFPLERENYDVTRNAEPTPKNEPRSPALDDLIRSEGQLEVAAGDFADVVVKAKFVEGDPCVLSVELPTSDDTLSSIASENTTLQYVPELPPLHVHTPTKITNSQLLDLVRIHGHRHNRQTPPPVPIKAASENIRVDKSRTVDIGVLQARIAAKRVAAFRKKQASEEARERALEAAWAQKRREIRRSNDAMYKQLGIAGLSAQDHLRLAQCRRKQETKQKEIAANQERQNRCRNCMPKRPSSAPDHVRELHKRHSREKRERERKVQQKHKAILENQQKLRQKANAIITKEHGAYIHGSYLLKLTHHTIKKQDQSPPIEGTAEKAES